MVILIAMLIAGLYLVISGKFGLGETVYLEGRRARIAGLIMLAPILPTCCLISLGAILESTGGFVSKEILDHVVVSSTTASWHAALQIALAYVNFHVTSRETKTRGGCLTLWLVFWLIGAITYQLQWAYPEWAPVALSVIQVIFCIAIWKWKKWGVLGFIAAMLIWPVIGLFSSDFILETSTRFLYQLSGAFTLGLLVKPKWHFFE